ncbi:MAG: hypothetical protein ACP5EK_02820 [Thermoplasmatota archaeon]
MYRLLIEGVPQARVARILGVSRQRVRKKKRMKPRNFPPTPALFLKR